MDGLAFGDGWLFCQSVCKCCPNDSRVIIFSQARGSARDTGSLRNTAQPRPGVRMARLGSCIAMAGLQRSC
jgi:hypothetical protein